MISWILSKRFTRPLKELAQATEMVATGNYATEVRPTSKDEIGTLAVSFNHMLEELSRSKAEAEGYRHELERKFVERGKELADTEKKRAAMAHMVAHDLKNPLLGIKKTLERLEQTRAETTVEQRRRILQELLSASDLVIGMVNEMLDLYRLTEQELKILHLLAEGLSNEEMSRMINLSRETIKMHLKGLFRKLEVKNRTEAAVLAVREVIG